MRNNPPRTSAPSASGVYNLRRNSYNLQQNLGAKQRILFCRQQSDSSPVLLRAKKLWDGKDEMGGSEVLEQMGRSRAMAEERDDGE
jgi:hypothetical protein